MYVQSTGAEQLAALGKALKEAGDKDLRRELLKASQRATRPVKQEVKKSAVDTLPRRGGLGFWVARLKIVTKTRVQGRNVGVQIRGSRDKRSKASKVDLWAINRGRVRHPVYGRWSTRRGKPIDQIQLVPKHFFTKVMEGPVADRARKEFTDAMQTIASQIRRKTAA